MGWKSRGAKGTKARGEPPLDPGREHGSPRPETPDAPCSLSTAHCSLAVGHEDDAVDGDVGAGGFLDFEFEFAVEEVFHVDGEGEPVGAGRVVFGLGVRGDGEGAAAIEGAF